MKRLTCIILLLLVSAEWVDAQSFYSLRRDRRWMFSYGLGSTTYHGDLHDIFYDGFTTRPSIGIGMRRKFANQLSVRMDLNWYQLAGADSLNGAAKGRDPSKRNGDREGQNDSRRERNLSFRSNNLELTALLQVNFLPIERGYIKRPVFNPYIVAGVAITSRNPRARFEGTWYNLRKYQTELQDEQTKKFEIVFPVGIGMRFKANQYIDITAEVGRRFTNTDYLDDISTQHVDPDRYDELFGVGSEKARIAKALSDRRAEGGFTAASPGGTRGNPEKNDAYYIFQLRLEMYLPDDFLKQIFTSPAKRAKFR